MEAQTEWRAQSTVTIAGCVAVVDTTWRIRNETAEAKEAPFLAFLPPGANLTRLEFLVGEGRKAVGRIRKKDTFHPRKPVPQPAADLPLPLKRLKNGAGTLIHCSFPLPAQSSGHVRTVWLEPMHASEGLFRYALPRASPGLVAHAASFLIAEPCRIASLNAPAPFYSNSHSNSYLKARGETEPHEGWVSQLLEIGAAGKLPSLEVADGANTALIYDLSKDWGGLCRCKETGKFVHSVRVEGASAGETGAKSVVFAVDLSGSMQGEKLDRIKALLKDFINDLNEQDMFNVLGFARAERRFQHSCCRATKEQKAAADAWVDALQAHGDTDMALGIRSGVEQLMKARERRSQAQKKENLANVLLRALFFFTDGDAGRVRQSELLRLMPDSSDISFFGVALGPDADLPLLHKFSARTGGLSIYVDPSDGAWPSTVRAFYQTHLQEPRLDQVEVLYTPKPHELFGPIRSRLHLKSALVFVGNLDADSATLPFTATVWGLGARGRVQFTVDETPVSQQNFDDLTDHPAPDLSDLIAKASDFWKVTHLLHEANYKERNLTRQMRLRDRALATSLSAHLLNETTTMGLPAGDASAVPLAPHCPPIDTFLQTVDLEESFLSVTSVSLASSTESLDITSSPVPTSPADASADLNATLPSPSSSGLDLTSPSESASELTLHDLARETDQPTTQQKTEASQPAAKPTTSQPQSKPTKTAPKPTADTKEGKAAKSTTATGQKEAAAVTTQSVGVQVVDVGEQQQWWVVLLMLGAAALGFYLSL